MQVAILCNHQRAVPKGHSGQMEKLEARLLELQAELDALSADYRAAQRAKNAAKAESCAPAPCIACTLTRLSGRCPPTSAQRSARSVQQKPSPCVPAWVPPVMPDYACAAFWTVRLENQS